MLGPLAFQDPQFFSDADSYSPAWLQAEKSHLLLFPCEVMPFSRNGPLPSCSILDLLHSSLPPPAPLGDRVGWGWTGQGPCKAAVMNMPGLRLSSMIHCLT